MVNNISWSLKGNIVYAASQWALLIVLAKVGSPEMVGRFTLGLAITAPLILFFNLQLRSVIATDSQGEYQFEDYIALRILTNIFALLAVASITLSIRSSLEGALVILLIGLMKVVESGSDILHGLMQKHERMDLIALSQMLRGFFSLVVFGITLFLTHSLLTAVSALAIVWLALLLFVDSPNAVRLLTSRVDQWSLSVLKPRWEKRQLQALAVQAFPLGLVSMFISYYITIPRYFLDAYHGEAALGYFAAMANLTVIGSTIIESLGQAALPRLGKYYIAGRSAYWNLLAKLFGVALILGSLGFAIAVFWGRPLLSFLYAPDYAQNIEAFLLIMAAGGVVHLSSVLGVGLTAARLFRMQAPILTTAIVACILISWWLIPDHGGTGAAWSLLMSSFLWVLLGAVALGLNPFVRLQREPMISGTDLISSPRQCITLDSRNSSDILHPISGRDHYC